MQRDFVALLLADSAIAGRFGTRIHWVERPQGSGLPAAVLYIVSEVNKYTTQAPDRLVMTRVQIDVFADTYADADQAFRVLKAKLNGYRGVSGSTEFAGVFIDRRRDQRVAGANDADRMFRVSTDVLIHHKEI